MAWTFPLKEDETGTKLRQLASQAYHQLDEKEGGFPVREAMKRVAKMFIPNPDSNLELGLATLPFVGKALPVAKRIERDAVLALGKRPKDRSTQALLEEVLSKTRGGSLEDIPGSGKVPKSFTQVGEYFNFLANYFGLKKGTANPIERIAEKTDFAKSMFGLDQRHAAAMINYLEMYAPEETNYLARQNKLPELTKWARKTIDDYINSER